MKTILALLLAFQTAQVFAETSGLTDLKKYLSSPARFSRVGYIIEDKRTYHRELSKEDFVEIFNATATLCAAQVKGDKVIISETKSRSLIVGRISIEIPFASASASSKMYESTVSYSDTTPMYFQSTEEIVLQVNGDLPFKYEMNFSHSSTGYYLGEGFEIKGMAIGNVFNPGSLQKIQCELNQYLEL